jgi:hypothetical protein
VIPDIQVSRKILNGIDTQAVLVSVENIRPLFHPGKIEAFFGTAVRNLLGNFREKSILIVAYYGDQLP